MNMKKKPILQDRETIAKLAEILSSCSQVNKYDNDNQEAWSLSHAFSDLEESFKGFVEILSVLVNNQLNEDEIYNYLLDIGEEFRHIIYHINDLKFYQYIQKQEQ